MKPSAVLRREGMADACVLLVAAKFVPTVGLEEFGNVLGLEQVELREAIKRWRVAQYEAAGVALPPDLGGKPPKPEKLKVVRSPGPVACMDRGCDLSFGDLRAMKAHHRMVHQRATCPECGGEFAAGGLGPHRAARHRKPAVAVPDAVAVPAPLSASGAGAAGIA